MRRSSKGRLQMHKLWICDRGDICQEFFQLKGGVFLRDIRGGSAEVFQAQVSARLRRGPDKVVRTGGRFFCLDGEEGTEYNERGTRSLAEDDSMPRAARKRSGTGLYHVMIRGADGRLLFLDDEDCGRFLDTLLRAKTESGFKLYAYCLMGNHVHLLLKEEREPLELLFRRIGASYVYYYNWKYQLHGHLFQDRFRSEAIEDDAYFLDVLRYICQNPVKAGLSKSPLDYPWLGCSGITTASALLDPFGTLTDLAGEDLLRFVSEACSREHLEDEGARRLTDREAIVRLCEVCGSESVQEVARWNGERRDEAIRQALDAGISIRQLARLTTISKSIIERVFR